MVTYNPSTNTIVCNVYCHRVGSSSKLTIAGLFDIEIFGRDSSSHGLSNWLHPSSCSCPTQFASFIAARVADSISCTVDSISSESPTYYVHFTPANRYTVSG